MQPLRGHLRPTYLPLTRRKPHTGPGPVNLAPPLCPLLTSNANPKSLLLRSPARALQYLYMALNLGTSLQTEMPTPPRPWLRAPQGAFSTRCLGQTLREEIPSDAAGPPSPFLPGSRTHPCHTSGTDGWM